MLLVHSAMAAMTGAGLGGKTYTDWLAHASARVGRPQVTFLDPRPTNYPSNLYLTTKAVTISAGYHMAGSPWSGRYVGLDYDPSMCRIVQHALPSLDALNQQIANEGCILLVGAVSSNRSVSAFTRNGYTSQSTPSAPSLQFTECSFWDFSLGKPQTTNPFAGTGPVDYAAAGW